MPGSGSATPSGRRQEERERLARVEQQRGVGESKGGESTESESEAEDDDNEQDRDYEQESDSEDDAPHSTWSIYRFVSPHFDTGMNPYVADGALTFGTCKSRIRQHCSVGDWVLVYGSTKGGVSGPLLCAFQVTKKIGFADYMGTHADRADALYGLSGAGLYRKEGGRFAQHHQTQEDLDKDVSGQFVLWSERFFVRPQLAAGHLFLTEDFRKQGVGYKRHVLPEGVSFERCEELLLAIEDESIDDMGSEYHETYLAEAYADELLEWAYEQEMHLYKRNRTKTRDIPEGKKLYTNVPKREWYKGERVIYRWGQTPEVDYARGEPMPPILRKIADRICKETGEQVNHALLIRYDSGTDNYAPAHQDKHADLNKYNDTGKNKGGAQDMVSGSSFFNVSVGTYARTFQIGTAPKKGGEALGDVLWEKKLAHGSMLKMTAQSNATHYHAVPKDPDQPEGKVRFSLVFRTIKTMAEHTSATRKKLQGYIAQSKDYLAQRKECAQYIGSSESGSESDEEEGGEGDGSGSSSGDEEDNAPLPDLNLAHAAKAASKATALQAAMQEGVEGEAPIAITITFGENGENHHAMQLVGLGRGEPRGSSKRGQPILAPEGFSMAELRAAAEKLKAKGVECEVVDLQARLPEVLRKSAGEAGVLLIRGGVGALGVDADVLLREMRGVQWDHFQYAVRRRHAVLAALELLLLRGGADGRRTRRAQGTVHAVRRPCRC